MENTCPNCVHWTTDYCRRCVDNNRFKEPDQTHEAGVRLNELLVRLNTYIDDMRGKQYGYNERFERTKNETWEHKADLLDYYASELVEIVKAY